jgi:hypothetical protein
VASAIEGNFDATAVIVGASVGAAFLVMLVVAAVVMRRRKAHNQIASEGITFLLALACSLTIQYLLIFVCSYFLPAGENVQPPLGLIKFDRANRRPNEVINVTFFSSFSDEGRTGWNMPEAHAPSPFTVALHPPDVLQLADLDSDDVAGFICIFVRMTESPSSHLHQALYRCQCLYVVHHRQVSVLSRWAVYPLV